MKNILLYGPPFSGKLTLLKAMARFYGAKVQSRQDIPGREIVSYVDYEPVEIPLRGTTISGSHFPGAWEPLLATCDAVAFVVDPVSLRNGVQCEYVEELMSSCAVGKLACVVQTKSDLATNSENVILQRRLLNSMELIDECPIFTCSSSDSDSLVNIFLSLTDFAVSR